MDSLTTKLMLRLRLAPLDQLGVTQLKQPVLWGTQLKQPVEDDLRTQIENSLNQYRWWLPYCPCRNRTPVRCATYTGIRLFFTRCVSRLGIPLEA